MPKARSTVQLLLTEFVLGGCLPMGLCSPVTSFWRLAYPWASTVFSIPAISWYSLLPVAVAMFPHSLLLPLLCSRSSCAMLWAACFLPGWPSLCVCLQSSSLSVSCAKVKSSSGQCTAAWSSWLKSAFSSPSVTLCMVSHQPCWHSDCSHSCASSWIPALCTQPQFPVRMDKGLKISTYQTCL